MKRTKIGLVLPATPEYSETFFRSKIQGLQNAGHQVTLFVGKKNKNFTSCPVVAAPKLYKNRVVMMGVMIAKFICLLFRTPARVCRFLKWEYRSGRNIVYALENLYLSSHILTTNLDWLHFGFATMGYRKENIAKAIKARMAVSLRGYDVAIYPVKHPGCYTLLWKRIDKLHVISDDLLALAYRDGLSADAVFQKITPAIDLSMFSRAQPLSNRLTPPFKFLTVARLHWKKGIEYTLEALAGLYQKGVDFKYSIIGTGDDFERLVFVANQLGIRDKVHFMDKLEHNQVKNEMEKADVYLQYSISEGFCNAVLEAQALGKICIVSDAEGLAENVLDGKTGFVVPKRNPLMLLKTIENVLTLSVEQHQAIRENAEQRVKAEFNRERQRNQFLVFYTT